MVIRVCHITSVHPAKDVRIYYKECLSLARIYCVYLIAPNAIDEFSGGIHIQGVDLPHKRLLRILHLNRIYKKAISINADVYHLHDPELMFLGRRLKRRFGKRIVFDSHEDVPQQILTKEYLPKWLKNPVSFVFSLVEKRVLRSYDALISVTPSIVERLKCINYNTVMITNYPKVEQYSSFTTEHSNEFKRSKYVCFAGGISQRYLHENVIRGLEGTDAQYLLAGPAHPDYLESLKKLDMWKRVKYLGVLDHKDVSTLYAKSFAGIVLLDYSPNVGYHKGTLGVLKMFEYMLAGIPVIATDFDLWKDIINSNECGVCINSHDIKAITRAINYYYNNPDVAREQGLRGKRAVLEKYNWATQEKVLLDLYQSLLQ